MDYTDVQQIFEYIDTRYRFTYHGFANLLEIEVLVDLPWYKSMWRTDGQERIWKRIYFGHSTPIEKSLELFKTGNKVRGGFV